MLTLDVLWLILVFTTFSELWSEQNLHGIHHFDNF